MDGWQTAQQICRTPTATLIDIFGTSDVGTIIKNNTLDEIRDALDYSIGDIVLLSDNTPGVVVGRCNDLPAVVKCNGDISFDVISKRTGRRCDVKGVITQALLDYDEQTQEQEQEQELLNPKEQLLARLKDRPVIVDIHRATGDDSRDARSRAIYCPETGERWDCVKELLSSGYIARSKLYEIVDTGRQYNGRSYRHC